MVTRMMVGDRERGGGGVAGLSFISPDFLHSLRHCYCPGPVLFDVLQCKKTYVSVLKSKLTLVSKCFYQSLNHHKNPAVKCR